MRFVVDTERDEVWRMKDDYVILPSTVERRITTKESDEIFVTAMVCPKHDEGR